MRLQHARFKRSQPGSRRLDQQQHFRSGLDPAPPPVMRFQPRQKVHTRRQARPQGAPRQAPRDPEIGSGHKDQHGSGSGTHRGFEPGAAGCNPLPGAGVAPSRAGAAAKRQAFPQRKKSPSAICKSAAAG